MHLTPFEKCVRRFSGLGSGAIVLPRTSCRDKLPDLFSLLTMKCQLSKISENVVAILAQVISDLPVFGGHILKLAIRHRIGGPCTAGVIGLEPVTEQRCWAAKIVPSLLFQNYMSAIKRNASAQAASIGLACHADPFCIPKTR